MNTYFEACSTASDDARAARTAAEELREKLAGRAPQALFAFATDDRDHTTMLRVAQDVLGPVTVVGASSPALFTRGRLVRDGVAMMVSADPALVVRSAVAEDLQARGAKAGAEAADAAMTALEQAGRTAGGDHAALLLLSDGIQGNSVDVARGVVESTGRELRMFGGGTGDDFRFRSTHQYSTAGVHSGAALAVGLSARGPLGVSLLHGCEPWGPPMHASGTGDRALKALDFLPAFERYCATVESLGEQPPSAGQFMQFAMLHPLGIVQGKSDHVLRSPLQATADGTVLCCSDIPPNALVRLMRGSTASLLDAARAAGAEARRQLGARSPAAALMFACVSRDVVLGSRTDDLSQELAAVREGIGADVPVFGCLTFGGFGALSSGLGQYHSKSVSVCVLPAPGPGDE